MRLVGFLEGRLEGRIRTEAQLGINKLSQKNVLTQRYVTVQCTRGRKRRSGSGMSSSTNSRIWCATTASKATSRRGHTNLMRTCLPMVKGIEISGDLLALFNSRPSALITHQNPRFIAFVSQNCVATQTT